LLDSSAASSSSAMVERCVWPTSIRKIQGQDLNLGNPPKQEMQGMDASVASSLQTALQSTISSAHKLVPNASGTQRLRVVTPDQVPSRKTFIHSQCSDDTSFMSAKNEASRSCMSSSASSEPCYTCMDNIDMDASFADASDGDDGILVTRPFKQLSSSVRPMGNYSLPGSSSPWRIPDTCNPDWHSRIPGFREDFSQLLLIRQPVPIPMNLLSRIFGDRLMTVHIKVNAGLEKLPVVVHSFGGRIYELVSTKLHRSTNTQMFVSKEIAAVYVLVAGGGCTPIDLQLALERLAGFGRLDTRKAAARLELFQSTALTQWRSGTKHSFIFDDLDIDDFEEITEENNEGCGFIPRSFIELFLGKHRIGKRTFSFQVRILSPRFGLFKGVLFEKSGIIKIQLPVSMKKVGSAEQNYLDKKVCLLINSTGVHPSATNLKVSKVLNGALLPATFKPTKLSEMIRILLKLKGVPSDVVDRYAKTSRDAGGSGLRHANLQGLADSTGGIPSGYVFVTGALEMAQFKDSVFVTRYPCTEGSDGLKLPTLTKKPATMSHADWDMLTGLAFGGLVFGKPRQGQRSLPSQIGGDLDGDLYFVLWQDEIRSHIPLSRQVHCDDADAGDEPFQSRQWNDRWFREAQEYMCDVPAIVARSDVISSLYKSWKTAIEDGDNTNAIHFGRGYKNALDIGKHGGLIPLPFSLWGKLPVRFHSHLVNSDG
jgi:hypothetical protein